MAITGTILAVSAVAGVAVEGYNAYNAHQDASHYKNQGNTVFNEQQDYAHQLDDLMKNPNSVTSLPGYQFQFDQGATAVSRQMAAGGFLNSGNQAAALTKYGQGLASNFYQQHADFLAKLSGLETATSPATYGEVGMGYQKQSDQSLESAMSTIGFLAGGSFGGAAGGMSTGQMGDVMATSIGSPGGGYSNTWNGSIYH